MATAAENLVILQRILDGIRDNNLNDVMSELGFEVSKSTDKSTEWLLTEPEEEFIDSETDMHMMVCYKNKQVRILRFPDNHKEKQILQYIRENPDIESVKTVGIEPERTYKL